MITTSEPNLEIRQIKLTLLETKPPIWRRLHIPAHLSLAQLHRILQIAMDWKNTHLHEFSLNRHRLGERALVSSVLAKTGDDIIYTYDLGDGWEHRVVLEKRLAPAPAADYPHCVAGRLACPPEDCGGVGGYRRLLRILADPRHPERDELRRWPGGFDPDAFSAAAVNRRLARHARPRGASR